MNGMTCKQCDTDEMAWVSDTEEIGNKERNEEWQMCQRNKTKNQSQKEKNNNKKTGTGTTSIMRTGSKYQDGGRGRGGRIGRSNTNQRHVRTSGIRFTETRIPEQTQQDQIHKFILKINPGIKKTKGIFI